MAVLVVAEHDTRILKESTHKAVSAALHWGEEVDVLVAGSEALAGQAAQIAGVRSVLHADSQALAQGLAEAFEQAIVPLMADYHAVVLVAGAQGRNVAPRIAARLDVAPIADVIAILPGRRFVRPIYAGNALETVESADPRLVVTIRPTAFAAAGTGGAATIRRIDIAPVTLRLRFVDQALVQSERPDLAGARIVVSGGRALGSAEEFRGVIEPLADRLGGAVGASRAAVDAGYAPNDCQVGQTGKVVAPDLYVAVGISGAIQHLAGMKDSRTIVAINKDPDAPIFQIADYGLVADYKTAVPELLRALAG